MDKPVSPGFWKRQMSLNSDGEVSRQRARALYPGLEEDLRRKKDHNRAEALLLGRWFFTRGFQSGEGKTASPSSKRGSSSSSVAPTSSSTRRRRSSSSAPESAVA